MNNDIQQKKEGMDILNRRVVVLSGILDLMKISPDCSLREISNVEYEIFCYKTTAQNIEAELKKLNE